MWRYATTLEVSKSNPLEIGLSWRLHNLGLPDFANARRRSLGRLDRYPEPFPEGDPNGVLRKQAFNTIEVERGLARDPAGSPPAPLKQEPYATRASGGCARVMLVHRGLRPRAYPA